MPVNMPRTPNAQCSRQQHHWTSSSCRVWPLMPRADGWGVAAATMTTSSAAVSHMRSSTAGLHRYLVTAEWLNARMHTLQCHCLIPNSVLQRSTRLQECTSKLSSEFCGVCTAVALAFKAQLVDSVPMMEHDRHVDVLVTADGVHRISTSGQSF